MQFKFFALISLVIWNNLVGQIDAQYCNNLQKVFGNQGIGRPHLNPMLGLFLLKYYAAGLREFGDFDYGIGEHGERIYLQDKGLDGNFKLLRILFPSLDSDGEPLVEENNLSNFANVLNRLDYERRINIFVDVFYAMERLRSQLDKARPVASLDLSKYLDGYQDLPHHALGLKEFSEAIVDALKEERLHCMLKRYPKYFTEQLILSFFWKYFNHPQDLERLVNGLITRFKAEVLPWSVSTFNQEAVLFDLRQKYASKMPLTLEEYWQVLLFNDVNSPVERLARQANDRAFDYNSLLNLETTEQCFLDLSGERREEFIKHIAWVYEAFPKRKLSTVAEIIDYVVDVWAHLQVGAKFSFSLVNLLQQRKVLDSSFGADSLLDKKKWFIIAAFILKQCPDYRVCPIVSKPAVQPSVDDALDVATKQNVAEEFTILMNSIGLPRALVGFFKSHLDTKCHFASADHPYDLAIVRNAQELDEALGRASNLTGLWIRGLSDSDIRLSLKPFSRLQSLRLLFSPGLKRVLDIPRTLTDVEVHGCNSVGSISDLIMEKQQWQSLLGSSFCQINCSLDMLVNLMGAISFNSAKATIKTPYFVLKSPDLPLWQDGEELGLNVGEVGINVGEV